VQEHGGEKGEDEREKEEAAGASGCSRFSENVRSFL
jgi:hypothetical protein